MLERISRVELKQKTFFCALIINKKRGVSGVGFYELCTDLSIKKIVSDLQQECFDYWSKQESRKR